MSALFAILIAASPLALAADPLPAGVYQSPFGTGQIHREGAAFIITDPSMPGVQIVGDLAGACQVQARGVTAPCYAEIGQGAITVTVPALGTSLAMRYVGATAGAVTAPGPRPRRPSPPRPSSRTGRSPRTPSTRRAAPATTSDDAHHAPPLSAPRSRRIAARS